MTDEQKALWVVTKDNKHYSNEYWLTSRGIKDKLTDLAYNDPSSFYAATPYKLDGNKIEATVVKTVTFGD